MKLIYSIIAFLTFIAGGFYFYQASGAIGGAISLPKLFWLFFCIYSWFILPPLALYSLKLPEHLKVLLKIFSALMWGRGILEMFMMFVLKNWRPPYGIAHDILCIVVVTGLQIYYNLYKKNDDSKQLINLWGRLIIISLIAEAYFAATFFEIVAEQTIGEKAVWFANNQDPKFILINNITFTVNILVYSWLAYLISQIAKLQKGYTLK